MLTDIMDGVTMHKDAIIIGGGPAGLQLAYFLEKRGADYLVLEKSDHVGSFFSHFPRQRQLISINKPNSLKLSSDNSLRFDWNSLLCSDCDFRFTKYSDQFYPDAAKYVNYLNDFALRFNLKIIYNTAVENVCKCNASVAGVASNANDLFKIVTAAGETYVCKQLFVACGLTEKYIPDDIRESTAKVGANLTSYASMTLDPSYYIGKSIAIIGTGNAAFETANYLNNFTESIAMVGPSKVAWKSHYPGHLRSKNMGFIDTLYLKMGNIIYYDEYAAAEVILIQNNFLNHSGSKLHEVLYCGGFRCQLGFFKSSDCTPEVGEHTFPILNSHFESVNVKNLYFIGASMQSPDWKHGTSSFIHGFRYNIEFLDRVLHNDIQVKRFPTIAAINQHIVHRINESSCLHHRHKWFCDVVVINSDGFSYFEDLYIPFLDDHKNSLFKQDDTIIMIYMDYGGDFSWSLKQAGGNFQSDIIIPFRNDVSKFLHPVFKIMFNNGASHTYHVGESPTGQFHHPIYKSMVEIYTTFALTGATFQDISMLERSVIQLFYDYQDYLRGVLGKGGNLNAL